MRLTMLHHHLFHGPNFLILPPPPVRFSPYELGFPTHALLDYLWLEKNLCPLKYVDNQSIEYLIGKFRDCFLSQRYSSVILHKYSSSTFLATLSFLLWDPSLLCWDTPEFPFCDMLSARYFHIIFLYDCCL